MNTLYRDEILEHYKDPQNFGSIANADASSRQLNPFCGDEIEISLKWSKGKVVEDIMFSGKGCAISMAAGSMLTEYAKGKTKTELTKFGEDDMISLLGVDVSENRKKCALLALSVLKDCLEGDAETRFAARRASSA